MKQYKDLIIIFAVLLAIFTACNDAPTEMGGSFLPDTLDVTVVTNKDSILMPFDTAYITDKPQNNTGAILIGAAKQMRAGAILRYDFPNNLEWIKEEDIVSADLVLYPQKYALGDVSGTNRLNFEIKEIIKYYDVASITPAEVLDNNDLYGNLPALATWNGSINYTKDTLDSIAISMPKPLCIEWFRKRHNNDTVNGIALLPKSDCTVINQFSDGDTINHIGKRAFFRVIYRTANSPDSATKAKGIDTLTKYSGQFIKFVSIDSPLPTKQLTIQGSARVHSRLDFDISQIPSAAMINYANIELTLDESQSYHGNDSLEKYAVLWLYKDPQYDFQNKAPILPCYGVRVEGTNKFLFRDSVAIAMMYFLRNGGKGSLVLAHADYKSEQTKLNRLVFYGKDVADVSKRPKLKLIYSEISGIKK